MSPPWFPSAPWHARVTLLVALCGSSCLAFQPETGDRLEACVDADSNPAVAVSFKDQVRPLLSSKVPGTKGCDNCHYASGGTREGIVATGLNLETLKTLRAGGRTTSGNILVPGSPCQSAIVQKLRGTLGTRMPKNGPFWEPAQIRIVMDWIAEGAKGDDAE